MKIIRFAALLSIAMAVPAGCDEPPVPASAPKPVGRLGQIAARGELRVCSTGDYRPFTYYQPGISAWSGIDVDMADDLAHRLGVRRTMVQTSCQKAYLLPLGDTAFQNYVDQWLNLARHDGTYQRITQPWLGDRRLTGQPARFSRAAAMTAYAASSATTQTTSVARATGCS
jgi:ABC-type amino acid transport substrate-binding protein